jgi:hypothetical protein
MSLRSKLAELKQTSESATEILTLSLPKGKDHSSCHKRSVRKPDSPSLSVVFFVFLRILWLNALRSCAIMLHFSTHENSSLHPTGRVHAADTPRTSTGPCNSCHRRSSPNGQGAEHWRCHFRSSGRLGLSGIDRFRRHGLQGRHQLLVFRYLPGGADQW